MFNLPDSDELARVVTGAKITTFPHIQAFVTRTLPVARLLGHRCLLPTSAGMLKKGKLIFG